MSTKAGGFLAGGLAACGAVTVTHPFETVKTRYGYSPSRILFCVGQKILTALLFRLQLQGELAAQSQTKRVYTGVLQGVRVIYVNEGLRGLFAGLGAAVTGPFLPNPQLFHIPVTPTVLRSTVLLPNPAKWVSSRFL